MTALLNAGEMRQNEEAAGRHPVPTGGDGLEHRPAQVAIRQLLARRCCPLCHARRVRTQAFCNEEHTEYVAYAACANCGHHERL